MAFRKLFYLFKNNYCTIAIIFEFIFLFFIKSELILSAVFLISVLESVRLKDDNVPLIYEIYSFTSEQKAIQYYFPVLNI